MAQRVIHDFVIPARTGRAVEVMKGQVLRIHLVEDKQVGDCAFFNLHERREAFHVGQSWALNVMLGHGNGKCFKYFYSKPPRENVMFEVIEDTVGAHWSSMGGRCSRRLLELRDGDTDHRSCQENLTEAVAPWGIEGDDIVDVFNVFMNVDVQPRRHVRRSTRRPRWPATTSTSGRRWTCSRPSRRVRRIATRPTTGRPKPLGITVFAAGLSSGARVDGPTSRREPPRSIPPAARVHTALVGMALRDEAVVGEDVEGRLVGGARDLDVRGPASEPPGRSAMHRSRAPPRRWRGSTASRHGRYLPGGRSR